jgi:NCAIR mutase (PurE)-related protein
LSEPALAEVAEVLPDASLDPVGRTAVLGRTETRGRVAIVAAGTSDLPVVRECAATVGVFGSGPDEIVDVGVAGLHRLVGQLDRISEADVAPLIAVPTSVGYGWNLDGVTAWLATVNSCAPGVVTVNVDNGFGAGVAAARIARRIAR